jgi:crotonobetainyl-CoA:carnitine CoA-transferase CaiB-like acyl-CoA transferase
VPGRTVTGMRHTTHSRTETIAELARRRRQILAALDVTEAELCERAEALGLCSDEWAALAELAEIDHLIAERGREHLLAG